MKTAYFLLGFMNELNSSPPNTPPYNVLFNGLDVIAQAPFGETTITSCFLDNFLRKWVAATCPDMPAPNTTILDISIGF